MTASTRASSSIPLRGAAAILLIFAGIASMIVAGFIGALNYIEQLIGEIQKAHIERFIGVIEGGSIALLFIGLAVALKTVERTLRIEDDSAID
jgi:preprotein translocase subunit SecY